MAKVLLVDDDEIVRELYGAWLENSGYQVLIAGSADEARARLEHTDIDVVVSDIRMAHETGIDLLAWVRQRDPDLPVILVTGVPALETAVEAVRRQAYDYLVKPVQENILIRTVKRAVEHRQLILEKQRLERENLQYQMHLEALVAQRTAAVQQRTRQLMLLHEVAHTIARIREEQELYENVVELTQRMFGYASVSVFVVDWHHNVLKRVAISSSRQGVHAPYTQSLDRGLLGKVAREGQALVANDTSQFPEFIPCPDVQCQAEAIFPIRLDGQVVALLHVAEDERDVFDETDEIVLRTLSEYLSISVANARLFHQLQEALKAREEILNNVSHELRTPLTIIRGYAELLLEGVIGDIDEETREVVDIMLQQTQHLTYLVDQLVAFRKLEREGITLEEVNFGEWLRHAVASWQPVMEEAGLSLMLDVGQDLGYVWGNLDYLTQVINNLLDNARKFSEPGQRVTVRAWRDDSAVYVSVQDEGQGVPPDQLERIFERFYQVDGGITRQFAGMGLGLALVKEIIERHNGRVWAESDGEGQGLTVTFTLPLARPSEK